MIGHPNSIPASAVAAALVATASLTGAQNVNEGSGDGVPPTRLSAVALGPTAVALEWTATEGSDAYRIFRRLGFGSAWCSVGVAEGNSTAYTDETVQGSSTYLYYVEAVTVAYDDVPRLAIVTTPPEPGFQGSGPSFSPRRPGGSGLAVSEWCGSGATSGMIHSGEERVPGSVIMPDWLHRLEDELAGVEVVSPFSTAHPMMR